MKRNLNSISLILLLVIYIALLNFIQLMAREKVIIIRIIAGLAQNRINIEKNTYAIRKEIPASKIEVDFWKVKQDTLEKGEYLGSAIATQGNIYIDIKDPRLKEILENPYAPVGELSEEGTVKDWLITLNPGTTSHLKAIAREAWRWGYLAESSSQDKP